MNIHQAMLDGCRFIESNFCIDHLTPTNGHSILPNPHSDAKSQRYLSVCSLFSDGESLASESTSTDVQPCMDKPRSVTEAYRNSDTHIPKWDMENPDTPNNAYRARSVTVCVPSLWTRAKMSNSCPPTGHGKGKFQTPLRKRDSIFERNKMCVKKVHTEEVMPKHMLKGKLSKFQRLTDKAMSLVNSTNECNTVDGAHMIARIMINAWMSPKIGRDLAYGLCDYLRRMGYLDILLDLFLNDDTWSKIRLACGRVLEECLSSPNRKYISDSGNRLERLVSTIRTFKSAEPMRIGISILEDLFKDSPKTNRRLLDVSALEFVLNACQITSSACDDTGRILRHAAQALANLSMTSDHECQLRMMDKNVADWLFLLASSQDDVTRYYACLAVCALVTNKELESAVVKSGTLALVEPFLSTHQPSNFSDYKHCQGQTGEWLQKLIPFLNAKRSEPRSMAAFQLAMEAGIKKDQDLLIIFHQIDAVDALKRVASMPGEVGPKLASLALRIIGEQVPRKLTQQVALWSVEDVRYWVTKIGFEKYANAFEQQRVDGDLLLLLSDDELARDIGMGSNLMRKRFMRELDSLKIAADYSGLDQSNMDRFLCSIDSRFSIYTYKLLDLGVDCSTLPTLDDDILKFSCGISNAIHRKKLLQNIQGCKDTDDMELAILSKHIDVFISYRRSTGSQLASLIKVLLQLRGYKVFIDIDRLYAGKFDCSLLKNIQAAKHFILVLTPASLDRCIDDHECIDWVHKEISCAVQHNKNVIPVFDPDFEWPDETRLPSDIRAITRFNGVRWVHEYQEACIAKLEKFITGEINMNILASQSRLKCAFNNRPITRTGLSSSRNNISDLDEKCEKTPIHFHVYAPI